jgi:hypothetical protein
LEVFVTQLSEAQLVKKIHQTCSGMLIRKCDLPGLFVDDGRVAEPQYVRSKVEVDDETGEPLYWSNEDGWVDRESATPFTPAEAEVFQLPADSYWV